MIVLAAALATVSCATDDRPPAGAAVEVPATSAVPDGATASVLLVGDVMLGRSVAPVLANDRDSVFEHVRPTIAGADLALANLESPLTTRPHLVGANALEANPSGAALLATTGFDGMMIANNHAGDAGPETVADTSAALATEGIEVIGAGADVEAAATPVMFVRNSVRIAVLAFDLTHGGPVPGARPGVATWDADVARRAIELARASADVVIVGLHGGVEYLVRPDPVLSDTVADLAAWGADVVWGNGAHVPYAVSVTDNGGRRSVVAPGLGNAVFDHRQQRTTSGTILEVLVGQRGALAWRTAPVGTYLRMSFDGWDAPEADAVAFDGEWWNAAQPVVLDVPAVPTSAVSLGAGSSLVVARIGDVDGDGRDDVLASYRRPFRSRLLQTAFPDTRFVDATGRAAHLGLYRLDGSLRWGAGTMPQPVAALDICDDGVALGFSALDDPTVIAGAAWWWHDFGFATAPTLAGDVTPGCADVDGDGRSAPALVRSAPSGPPSLIRGDSP